MDRCQRLFLEEVERFAGRSATPRSALTVALFGKGKRISTRFAGPCERTVGKSNFWRMGQTNGSAWLSA
jgi:hypothetical protein